MPLLQTLVDGFDGSSLNSVLWSNFTSAGTTFAVGGGVITFTTTTVAGYSGLQSQSSTYDLTSSFAMVQVVSAGNQALASLEVVPMEVDKDSSNKLFWYINTNSITAFKTVAGVQASVASTAYNSAIHKWLRIQESGGRIYYDYSTDGLIWTNFTNLVNPFVITAVFVAPSVGTFAAEASGTSTVFDNFDVIPPLNIPPVSIFSPLNPQFKFTNRKFSPPTAAIPVTQALGSTAVSSTLLLMGIG